MSTKQLSPRHMAFEGSSPNRRSVFQRIFPSGFMQEFQQLFTLAWPITLCAFLTFAPTIVSTIFCGHLGKDELDAVVLANSMLNMTGVYICTGLVTACDTVFSQAYGRHQFHMIGIYLQRGFILVILTCFVCWSFHLNIEYLLLLMHQDVEVSRLTADYIIIFMPGLLFNFVFQLCVKYLQSQNNVISTSAICLIGNIINAVLQYVLIYTCGLRSRGSAIAQSISWFLMCVTVMIYIRMCGVMERTWTGWSWVTLENWASFLKLAVAGVVIISAEWCTFEGGLFFTGILGVVQQSAIGVSVQIVSTIYMVLLGMSFACSIRVGQNLGAGDSDGAKTAYRVAQLTSSCIAVMIGAVLFIFRLSIPYLFTNDSAVADLVSQIIPYLVAEHIMESITLLSSGALKGCGLQAIAGILNFVEYCVVALPTFVCLVLYTGQGALGFWQGMILAISLATIAYIVIIAKIDWKKRTELAMKNNEESIPLSPRNQNKYSGDTTDNNKKLSPVISEMKSDMTKGQWCQENECKADQEIRTPKHKLILKLVFVCLLVLGIFVAGLVIRILTDKTISARKLMDV